MNAEISEVIKFVDSNIGVYVVEKFRHFRENGLFLDVTINVSSLYTSLFFSLVNKFLMCTFTHYACKVPAYSATPASEEL